MGEYRDASRANKKIIIKQKELFGEYITISVLSLIASHSAVGRDRDRQTERERERERRGGGELERAIILFLANQTEQRLKCKRLQGKS